MKETFDHEGQQAKGDGGFFEEKRKEGHIFKDLTQKGKKALAVGMALGAAAVGYEGVKHKEDIAEKFGEFKAHEANLAKEREIKHTGTGVIVEKISHSGSMGFGVALGHPEMGLMDPSKHLVKVKVGNEFGIAKVSKEDLKQYKEGQNVEVSYNVREFDPKTGTNLDITFLPPTAKGK